ncbi:ASKHA domain-containing protein [Thermoanaerobacter wiegelii]|nr:ASKHA domain-containing protein [Thermoanaerobacter wiegelii]
MENKIPVQSSCGGHGTCGECRVIMHPVKQFNQLTPAEKKFISLQDTQKGYRLACTIFIDQDMEVIVPEVNKDAKILSVGDEKEIELKLRVKKINVIMKRPELDDQRDDLKRLEYNIGRIKSVPNVIRKLPNVLRQNEFNINVVIRNGELLDVVSPNNKSLYGIAMDIGTTTIVAYLIDLNTGKQLDVYSNLNPQKPYGADVITRINYTITNPKGLEDLHNSIIDEVNNILAYFYQKNGINSNDIYEIVVVGNTTMMHIFAGIPCVNIANAPYIPAYTKELEFKASEIGININPNGYIVMLPMVSGYVGADTIAAIIASGMYESKEMSLLGDIGTNGEIVLGNKDKMVSCSAAAGPAFEGAEITFGTVGVAGAISYVDLNSDSIYKTIGDKRPPIGICGSGIVDTVSELIKKGIVDEAGKMHKAEELEDLLEPRLLKRLVEYNGQVAFVLDDSTGIVLTQKDIREFQLAKGAIAAGINILINELGIEAEDIQKVYFAGGFGNYIRIESAINIGLIPKILKDRIIQIGNAAGVGAKMALLSNDYLKLALEIKNKVKYIELFAIPEFQIEFMNAMYF